MSAVHTHILCSKWMREKWRKVNLLLYSKKNDCAWLSWIKSMQKSATPLETLALYQVNAAAFNLSNLCVPLIWNFSRIWRRQMGIIFQTSTLKMKSTAKVVFFFMLTSKLREVTVSMKFSPVSDWYTNGKVILNVFGVK